MIVMNLVVAMTVGDPNVATCENTAPNTIGPITQTNQGFTDNNDGRCKLRKCS